MNIAYGCPNCGANQLRSWGELSTEEREVVRGLPGAQDYSPEERQKTHLWCTRCWYESPGGVEQTA